MPPQSSPPAGPRRYAEILFGVGDLLVAFLVGVSALFVLPARYFPVDAAALAVVIAWVAAGVALLGKSPMRGTIARIAATLALAVGVALVALLVASTSYLAAIHGEFGRPGAVLFAVALALVIPYLVVFPAVQWVYFAP